ncbi:hypothetical protein PROFUN_14146 [Planoprotostelium fungivorum]|uniref:Uncharacterized protein n=1 Tax=Planoprotostelium fungivorum TaxID=1890364 RepID=A0A2P6N1K8_9EUKA|nr:hypothetical protein PROFUN_14146 [Planoprotostelium fungivorum]
MRLATSHLALRERAALSNLNRCLNLGGMVDLLEDVWVWTTRVKSLQLLQLYSPPNCNCLFQVLPSLRHDEFRRIIEDHDLPSCRECPSTTERRHLQWVRHTIEETNVINFVPSNRKEVDLKLDRSIDHHEGVNSNVMADSLTGKEVE